MQVQVTFVNWAVLMLSLGQIVLWECRRRRNGPSLKPGHLDQLNSSRPSYTPPADRPRRFALDPMPSASWPTKALVTGGGGVRRCNKCVASSPSAPRQSRVTHRGPPLPYGHQYRSPSVVNCSRAVAPGKLFWEATQELLSATI